MALTKEKYSEYIAILREELVPALGCTEPIALAYAAAKARDVLGELPSNIVAHCSSNIIKNVMCVTVPNTAGLTGIPAAVIAGAVGGNASNELSVLEGLTDEHRAQIRELLDKNYCTVKFLESQSPLHIRLYAYTEKDEVMVEVKDAHTNINCIEKNGEIVFKADSSIQYGHKTDRSVLNVKDIMEFADTVDLSDVKDLLNKQIECNIKIAEEGLKGEYGVGIGKVILNQGPNTVFNKMKAYASSASEARMSGCPLPVIINSGSGNQGITSSVPVIIYCREMTYPEEKLYRALVFSNLITIHLKTGIGPLSAFCGVVCASCASGAAVIYLETHDYDKISMSISNVLASVTGLSCDGAKPSCGSKIAACLDAAFVAGRLAIEGKAYKGREGIVRDTVEETISAIGHIGSDGMKDMDRTILEIMLG